MNDKTRTNKTHIETRFFIEAKFRNEILYIKSMTRVGTFNVLDTSKLKY